MDVHDQLPFLSRFYDDKDRSLRVMPFLVGHVGRMQDIMVWGPQSVAELHNNFIDTLYAQLDSLETSAMYLRAFTFNEKLCIAVVLPTPLKDEAGRTPLVFSFGTFIYAHQRANEYKLAQEYLLTMFRLLNAHYGLELPRHGATEMLRHLRSISEGASLPQFTFFSEGLLMIAKLANSFHLDRISAWQRVRSLVSSTRQAPSVIFYSGEPNTDVLLRTFFSLLSERLPRSGRTAVHYFDENHTTSPQHITTLEPIPSLLWNAARVRVRKIDGMKFLMIYK